MNTFKGKTKVGLIVSLTFSITQHSRDVELLKSLIKFLDCGRYKPRSGGSEAGDFVVTRLSDITDILIPFFDKYPLQGASPVRVKIPWISVKSHC